jgi:RecJ-like exonuclease
MSLQEFCRKYPEYCNPELYEKITRSGQAQISSSTYRRIYASDVKPELVGSIVLVEGVVADVSKKEYTRRSGQGKVKVTNFNLYDKTGKVFVKSLGENHLDIEDWEIVRVVGRIEEWRGSLELRVFNLERIGRIEVSEREVDELATPPQPANNQQSPPDKKTESIGKVLTLLRSVKNQGKQVYYDRLIGLLGRLGLEFKDIEQYVEVKEVSRPGSLEKVKVVELKE